MCIDLILYRGDNTWSAHISWNMPAPLINLMETFAASQPQIKKICDMNGLITIPQVQKADLISSKEDKNLQKHAVSVKIKKEK